MNRMSKLSIASRRASRSRSNAVQTLDDIGSGVILFEIGLGRLIRERELDAAIEAKAAVAARAAWELVMVEAKRM